MERGMLRIYLGAAPGVGKTYAMLSEARRRRDRGSDVVVGVVETHGRAMTAAQLGDLEVIPRRNVEYRGTTLSELDVDAVLVRHPDVVAIDEYAHTNAPGSRNEKRWQDVEQVLAAGIDVITTVNVQHLESLNDVVAEITGITPGETVPDRMVRAADQIELVDMSPEALRRRMAHGNIYPADRADAALANFFRPGNLGALRELALLWVADRVEEHLGDYLDEHGLVGTWETRERVVVGLTGAPGADAVIRRAARIARRVGGELIGVHVAAVDARVVPRADGLAQQFALLESLGGTRRDVVGEDAVRALVDVARDEHATQIVIGATRESRWRQLLHGSFVARLSRTAPGIDVHVVGADPEAVVVAPASPSRPRAHDRRRTWMSVAVFAVTLPTLTVILHRLREHLDLSTHLLLYLVLVMATAALGGRVVATVAALVSAVALNWFFVEPRYTLTIDDVDDVVALVVFVAVGLAVAALVDRIAAQAAEASRTRAEAAILARAAAMLAADPEPVDRLIDALLAAFRLSGARLVQSGDSDVVVATAGEVTEPESTIEVGVSPTGERRSLVVGGRSLTAGDRRVLTALAAQLGVAIDRQAMRRDARRALELAAVDRARVALLRAVSHDLRTPLATIKALASGLLDSTVVWRPEQLAEMHETIDQEADRLDRLIGNLLDAGRLETGTLAVSLDSVELGEAITAAVGSLSHRPADVRVDVPASVPPAVADRSLLERAIANLVDNASRYSPPDAPIAITAAQLGDEIHVCVIDRGVGIPSDRRGEVLAPFQRLDDTGSDGVGLGLAIVDGFVRAMGGTLLLDDTPGGGLTATITLHRASEAAASVPRPVEAT